MASATLVMLDPRAAVNHERRDPVRPVDSLRGKTVGVLDNGLQNSTPLMKALVPLLEERFGRVLFRTKPSQSRGASNEWLEEFAAQCHVVITGVGD